jgi:hypothetical protein
MTIRLIKDETTSTTHWYLTQDDIYIRDSIALTESEGIEKFNNYILNNKTSNKITIICESKINEPNESI